MDELGPEQGFAHLTPHAIKKAPSGGLFRGGAACPDVEPSLAYLAGDAKVDEDKAGVHLGEVSELDPGKTGALRLDLAPGTYLPYCNIPNHYMAGMWTLFTTK